MAERVVLSCDNDVDILQGISSSELAKDLVITEKGKLKWCGDLITLQLFIEDVLNIKGKWTTTGGAKVLKTETTTIRWYTHNETLTISGPAAEEIKEALELKANYHADNPEVLDDTRPSMLETFEKHALTKDSIETEGFASKKMVNDIKMELNDFKRQFESYRSEVNKTIQGLLDKPEEESDGLREREINRLRQENHELKEDNKALTERMDNLAYILSDLNNKAKIAEEEKASLLTAIRLLYSDIENATNGTNKDQSTKFQSPNYWYKKNSQHGMKKGQENILKNTKQISNQKSHQTRDILGTNRFSSLEVEESQNDDDIASNTSSDEEESSFRTRDKKDKQKSRSSNIIHSTSSKTKPSTTVIIGDSMIKHLDTRRLRRSVKEKSAKITAETYRGADIDAMKHHIKPCLIKKPDRIILHVGTNNLTNKNEKEIVEGIVDICQIIRNENPGTDIVVSELVLRTDKPEYKQKLNKVNNKLFKYCKQKNWGIIKHDNIEPRHINPYGIHLNRAGTSVLARNITAFLNEDNHEN